MMRVPWHYLETWLFPMAVFSFLATAVQYLNQIFGPTQRWGFLALLLLYLVARGRLSTVFRGSPGAALLLIVGWNLATILWSIVPSLSFAKGIAFFFVAVVMNGAGQYWVLRHGSARSMDYLLPSVLLAVLVSALGRGVAGGGGIIDTGGTVTLYQGLTSNPNMFGSLMAMSLPLLLWRVYKENLPQWRSLWMLLLGGILVSLLLSNSRAALLMALATCLGMFLAVDLRRRQLIVSMTALLALLILPSIPTLLDIAIDRYVYKGGTQDQGLFFSREQLWKESSQHALEGGLQGVGYGATVGATSFAGGLTAVGYGREKGNTQMAIMEETGLIGLGLYAAFLILLFRRMLRSFRWARTRDERVLLGILTGMLVGLTLQGIFEAWWVAPGSPEAAYWWAFVGVASGVPLALERREQYALRLAILEQAKPALPE